MTARPNRDAFSWCFSTMGCPQFSFVEACALAAEFHVPGLELRSLGGTTDLPSLFTRTGLTLTRISQLLHEHSVRLMVAGSSFKLTGGSEVERADFLRFCEWADALNIPFVRVFGGGTWGGELTAENLRSAVQNVKWWRKERKNRGWSLELLMETHDAFSASTPCLKLNEMLDEPVLLIWDTHHTWRLGGESPAESWRRIGPLVRHVQVKDSVDQPSARHPYTYVLPGDGQMPLADVIAVLRENNFAGGVSLEWELLWHPYLPPLRTALERLQAQPWFAPSSYGLKDIATAR